MRIVITGGTGFLGPYVVRLGTSVGHEIFGIARSQVSARRLAELGVTPLHGDLEDPGSIDEAFRTCNADVLINLASLGFGHAQLIVDSASKAQIGRAVFVSTTAVSTSLPAPSKDVRLAAEQSIRESGLQWTVIRPTMIYGADGDRNVARLLRLLRHTRVIPVPGGGRRLQQPVHVEDLAQAIWSAATTDAAVRRTYDVAGPEALTFRELLLQAGEAVGRRPTLLWVPLRPAVWALRAYECASRNAPIKAEQLQRLSEDKAFDIGSAAKDLDFCPRPFAAGVRAEAGELWA